MAVANQFRNWRWKIYQGEAQLDLDRSRLIGVFCDFAEKLRDNDEVVIFYTGHGWEVEAEPFLYPTDASRDNTDTTKGPEFPSSFAINCHSNFGSGPVSLHRLLALFPARLAKLIVFYDACRGRGDGVTADGKPMKAGASSAAIQAIRATLPSNLARVAAFSFATSPGQEASAGEKRSPYVDAFLFGAQSETNLVGLLNKISNRSYSRYGQSVDFQGLPDLNYWIGPKPRVVPPDRPPPGVTSKAPPPQVPAPQPSHPLQTPP